MPVVKSRIIMLEWSLSYHRVLAQRLSANGIDCLYWTGSNCHGLNLADIQKIWPNATIQSTKDAIRGECTDSFQVNRLSPPPHSIWSALAETESEAYFMMNRMDYCGDFSYPERACLYRNLVIYWYNVLSTLRPDAVVFSISPHMVYDFIAYRLCQALGIRTLMFDYTRFPGRILKVERFEDGCRALDDAIRAQKETEVMVEDLDEDLRLYYLNQTDPNADSTPFYMKKYQEMSRQRQTPITARALFSGRLKSFFKVPYLLGPRDINWIQYKFEKRRWLKKLNELRNDYERLAEPAELSRNFVYVPLSYQPERTTSPLAGRYVDQILMLKTICASLPEGWEIYVKEHPRQLHPSGSHPHQGREIGYYERLRQIPHVRLISQDASTFALMEHTKAVVTTTGTAGWEARIRGKPTIIFGHPWYRACPGIFVARDTQDVKRILSAVHRGEITLTSNDVLRFLRAVQTVNIRSYVDTIFESNSNIRPEEANYTLAEVISRFCITESGHSSKEARLS